MGAGMGASAATSIVGGELQGWAALLDKWNMQQAYADEIARQNKYAGQAGGVFKGNVTATGSDSYANNMAQGQAARQGVYSGLASLPSSAMQRGGGDQSLQSQRDTAANLNTGQRRAALESYSDAGFKQGLSNISSQRGLDKIINFAGGTASVFPYRMYEAQHSNDALSQVGAAISSLGGGQGTNWSAQNQFPQQGQQQQMQQQPIYWSQPNQDYYQNQIYSSPGTVIT